jgi:mRNA-degrading endonuclease toxin of MazEF toxin-antitoxin module
MRQWDIFNWEFPFGKHPCVIISHPQRVSAKPTVNILKCSSQRASRATLNHEVMLDEADGLEWETLCQCDLIYVVDKSELRDRRGSVNPVRRKAIISKIIQNFGWTGI